jgi:hypothetical protein
VTAAQGVQECALDGIVVRVQGEQPSRLGCLLTGKRTPRPSPAGEQPGKPPGVACNDALPLPGQVVRKPARIWIAPRRGQVANPLILRTPVQQLPPEFFIHQAIAPEQPSEGKALCSTARETPGNVRSCGTARRMHPFIGIMPRIEDRLRPSGSA